MNTTTRTIQRTSRRQAAPATALPRLRQQRLALSLSLALGSLAFCGGALAAAAGGVAATTMPAGGVVVGGVGSITQSGASTVVNQQSALLALNWQSFNLGKDASVLFNQPSHSAIALNRIFDQNPSQIFGHINSNGQVFLINTHGIIFGSSAQLNVGGLVASTLDLTPDDFLSRHFNLDAHGGSAGVVNHGTIQAASGGSVSLVGGKVENDGLIVANLGSINLDGADRAVLDFDGDGLVGVQVTGALQRRLDADEAAVANKGKLQADGGTVVLQASAAKDLFTNLVNNSGVIDAHGISTDGGVVRLVGSGGNTVDSGAIDASGVHGGSVQLLSDRDVDVGGNVDASGAQGGGSIRVGGGARGGEGLPQAASTTVEAGASLHADATQSGDGGSIAVWSNQASNIAGGFSARGGALGGNGGSIETSGEHVHIDDGTLVDTLAPHGRSGDWLIDPQDFTIAASGGDVTGAVLSSNLAGGNVTVLSSNGGTTGTGNINVNDAVSWSANTLTLTAANDIVIGSTGALTASGTAGLALNPATTNTNTAGTITDTGVAGGTTIIDSGGQLSLAGSGAMSLGNVTDDGALTFAVNGNVSYGGVVSGTGTLTQSGTGTLTLTGANTYTGGTTINAGTLALGAGGSLAATGAVTLANTSGASFDISAAGNQTIGSLSGGGTTGGTVVLGANTLTFGDATNQTFGGVINGTTGDVVKQGTGTATLTGANTYTGGTTINGGTLVVGTSSVLGSGNVLVSGALGTGAVGMAAGTTLGFSANGLSLANAITLDGAATFNVANGQADTLGGVIGGTGSLTKVGTGTLTLSGVNTYDGGTTVSAGALSVAQGPNLGAGSSVLTLDGGTLQTNAPMDVDQAVVLGSGGGTIQVANASYAVRIMGGITGDGDLVVNGPGPFTIGSNITTGGSQTYNSAVRLDGGSTPLTLSSSGDNATIQFTSTLDGNGGRDLTVSATGTGGSVAFDAPVGSNTALSGLTTSSSTFSASLLNIGGDGLFVTTTGGGITQGDVWSVAGASTFNAGSNAITLTNAGNAFTGAVGLTGGTTQITNQGDLTLGALATGGLTAISGSGTLTLSGSGTVGGVLNAQAATSIAVNGSLTGLTGVAFTGAAPTGSGSLAGTGSITGLGSTTAFDLTGSTAGTAGGVAFSGFTAADAATVTGAAGFDYATKASEGMTFAGATNVAGTGAITNLGSTAFNLTGSTAGTAGTTGFSGFTAADATAVTGAAGFDDSARSSEGMTFAHATSVAGSGTVANVAGSFADDSGTSSASGIAYSGFGAVTGTGGSVTGVAGRFDLGTE
ncbi:MAG TPA: autotransporter-associated beta strand repeat-containing protein, partial [Rhodanobacter sp.]